MSDQFNIFSDQAMQHRSQVGHERVSPKPPAAGFVSGLKASNWRVSCGRFFTAFLTSLTLSKASGFPPDRFQKICVPVMTVSRLFENHGHAPASAHAFQFL